MTIGQIIECLFGKVCALYGAYGDCTAFQVKGPNYSVYGPLLTKQGFHSSGNQLLYNGMTGEQLQANIYIGPTYYMRLKHMVKDKINYRARGPNTFLTRQAVQGRANDGGLRIGEMERDGVLAHGMSYFLNESFLIRGDEYFMAICNKTGAIAIYNEARNLFLSPYADGPINFHTNPDGSMNIKNISKFGRSFSLLRIPYTFKLLIHELQCMNIQMRIITDNNIDQLLGMSYSDNINKLLQSDKSSKEVIEDYIANMKYKLNSGKRLNEIPNEPPILPDESEVELTEDEIGEYNPNSPDYAPNSPAGYVPNSPDYAPNSPAGYVPNSPDYASESLETPENYIREEQPDGSIKVRPRFSPLLNSIFTNMSKEEKLALFSKSKNEQINELKRLYKIQFLNMKIEEQEGILNKLKYNNSQYDVDNIATYLTSNNQGTNNQGRGMEDLINTTPLIKKPISLEPTNSSESILNVESVPVVSDSNNESNPESSSESKSESKQVSFDTSSSETNNSENSSLTKKIIL
jgi:hypothetical protein